MITIESMTVRYGDLTAVDNVSWSVADGEIFGLVGPNGAGKTTSIKVIAGLLLPDEGRAEVAGCDVVTQRPAAQAKIGYMADFFGVYDYLTVQEYLAFFGGTYGLQGDYLETRITRMLEATTLTEKRHAFVRTLSRGMKQRLYFARALIHEPKLLLLDEPASGMDPRGRAELVDVLKDLNAQGTTILISSHILSELQDLCTSVGLMERGRFVGIQQLRRKAADTATRRVVLLVAATDAERAGRLLAAHPDVVHVEATGSRFFVDLPDLDETVGAVVRHLVTENVCVLLPRADAADLKDIFLKMTKGELM